jgi:hypothetical protein
MKDIARCTAHRSGQPDVRCARAARAGSNVCIAHGAAAGQVKRKAQERIDLASDKAARTVADLSSDKGDTCVVCGRSSEPAIRLRASTAILDRAGIGPSGTLTVSAALPDRSESWVGLATQQEMAEVTTLVSRLREIKLHVIGRAEPRLLNPPTVDTEDEDEDVTD